MTPQQLKAMKLALEALEDIFGKNKVDVTVINVIKEVLAEHAMSEVQRLGQEIEQEPVVYQCPRCATSMQVDLTAKAALAQPEQEPVAIKCMKEWIEYLKRKSDFGQHMKIPSEMSAGACWELAIELEQFINTTPPQRKPLTKEQIEPIAIDVLGYGALLKEDMELFTEAVRAVESAHGIKGDA